MLYGITMAALALAPYFWGSIGILCHGPSPSHVATPRLADSADLGFTTDGAKLGVPSTG